MGFNSGFKGLTPSGHRQIRDVITTGIDMRGRRMRKGGVGAMDHTSVAPLTNQVCSDRVISKNTYVVSFLFHNIEISHKPYFRC